MNDPAVNHKFDPSKTMPDPSQPTPNVPRTFPSLARSLVTVPPLFGTQMFAPSKARAENVADILKVPACLPSSLKRVTVSKLDTQM